MNPYGKNSASSCFRRLVRMRALKQTAFFCEVLVCAVLLSMLGTVLLLGDRFWNRPR
jgi:hypothetical protein